MEHEVISCSYLEDPESEQFERLPDEPRLRDLQLTLWNVPKALLLGLIRLYQFAVSPSLPPNTCRFYPTCSHYGYQAIYKYGVVKGTIKATWRIIRCNPFNPGGYDPVL